MEKKKNYKPKNRLRIVMAEKEVRAKYIAESLNVSSNTVTNWVYNKTMPTVGNLYRLSELLEVSVCDLLVDYHEENEEII